ncbi:MAG: DUF4465 domain-containing protein [Crocinitomicaceae bacterium]|tara:strand:- start:26413 stop:27381 length:969 start_codon:yes stop_codon:yes gene_type:complete
MKKVYIFLTALFMGAQLQAQPTIDFESSLTDPETYDNGADGNGDFDFSPITLNNYYDADFNYFSGFAISNVTDNTTPGYLNQYSAYSGSGSNGSNTYAIGTSNPEIHSSSEQARIVSFDVSNTTYAGLSMLNGDSFAKQFGSPNNAAGEPDGTEGDDFFRVWVICENLFGEDKDSIEFYLADFRFEDNTEDYILNTWETIDLASLISFDVSHVYMRFESSDIGAFGMNTPGYVAIDNIGWEGTFGVSEVNNSGFQTYPNPVKDILHIKGAEGHLSLISSNGTEIFKGEHNTISSIDCSDLPSGVYLLKIDTENGTVSRRIVK